MMGVATELATDPLKTSLPVAAMTGLLTVLATEPVIV